LNNTAIAEEFAELSTPLITDAALRLSVPISIAPFGIRPVITSSGVAGRALPAKNLAASTFFSKR
jgi:4-hydroxy-4-methyl-2-oxoglutarate aldolase